MLKIGSRFKGKQTRAEMLRADPCMDEERTLKKRISQVEIREMMYEAGGQHYEASEDNDEYFLLDLGTHRKPMWEIKAAILMFSLASLSPSWGYHLGVSQKYH